MRKILPLLILLFLVPSFFAIVALMFNQNAHISKNNSAKIPNQTALSTKKAVLGTTTVDLFPNADTSLWSTYPTTNYGDGYHTLWAGYMPDKLRALIKFDFTSIAPTAIVSAATLNLYQYGASGTPTVTDIFAAPISGGWAENTATWNNKPPYDITAAVHSYFNTTLNVWETISVKQITQSWVNGTRSNNGFIIYSSESGANWHRYFNNRHNANKPYLHITYTIPDLTPPAISSVATSELTKTSVKITWKTDEASSSFIDYGATTAYGSNTGQADSVIDHSVTLGGLSGGTSYHFRVKSVDASGNTALSTDFAFTTATDSTPGTGVNANSSSAENGTSPEGSETVSLNKSDKATGSAAKTLVGKANYTLPILIGVVILIIVIAGAGGALYYFKFRKKLPNKPPEKPETPENKNPL